MCKEPRKKFNKPIYGNVSFDFTIITNHENIGGKMQKKHSMFSGSIRLILLHKRDASLAYLASMQT